MTATKDIEAIFSLDSVPDELLSEINRPRSRIRRDQVLGLLRIAGKPLNLDQLLVGMYRMHGAVEKRTALGALLFRMTRDEEVASPKKGRYALSGSAEQEAS